MRRSLLAFGLILCTSAAQAQRPEDRPIVSPNKKLEFRTVADQPAIYERGTENVILKLSEGFEGPATRNVVWAPDSRRFAFNYKESNRANSCVIYELTGIEWKALPEICDPDGPIDARLERMKTVRRKKLKAPDDTHSRMIYRECRGRRWIDDDNLELLAATEESVDLKSASDSVSIHAAIVVTLTCDNHGGWKTTKTRELTEKEASKISAEIDEE